MRRDSISALFAPPLVLVLERLVDGISDPNSKRVSYPALSSR